MLMSLQRSESNASDLAPAWLRDMHQGELQAYAELSGDRNPIHLDRGQAILAGHPDLICHGMLAMTDIGGWLVRAMAGWQLQSLSCRFVAPMVVGTRLKVSGSCVERMQGDEPPQATVDFISKDAGGDVRVTGRAIFQKPCSSQ
jgi:acyl dehydratase